LQNSLRYFSDSSASIFKVNPIEAAMTLNPVDIVKLLHPILAITFIFPLLGLTVARSWETRQRRLQTQQAQTDGTASTSKIPAIVGREHLDYGKLLAAGVVAIGMLSLARQILSKLLETQALEKTPFQVVFLALIYVATIICLILLYKTRTPLWRGVFATLTGMGFAILAFQPGVFHRNDEWYVSHFYYGFVATQLMIFSLAIVPNIYERNNVWRKVHIALNSFALLLFIGQGITGSRDLLEIPLSWQSDILGKCDWGNKTCP
jgi:hypothetical protein